MPLTRAEKEAYVAAFKGELEDAEAIVLSDYRGLDVAAMSRLRRRLRDVGVEFRVTKNTLALRAFKEAGLEPPTELLFGPTAITVLREDLAAPSKVLVDFAKESEFLSIKGGMLGGKLVDAATIQALAELPTRDELMAQLVGTLQAPMQQFVSVLAAPLRDFVGVLDARIRAEAGAEG